MPVPRVNSADTQIFINNNRLAGVQSFSLSNNKEVLDLQPLGKFDISDKIQTPNQKVDFTLDFLLVNDKSYIRSDPFFCFQTSGIISVENFNFKVRDLVGENSISGAYLTSYSIKGAVGDFVRGAVAYEANSVAFSETPQLTYSCQTSDVLSTFNPNKIKIYSNFNEGINSDSFNIQSFDLNIPIQRKPISRLGISTPLYRYPNLPTNGDLNFSIIKNQITGADLSKLVLDKGNITIDLNDEYNETLVSYSISGCSLLSISEKNDLDNNATLDFAYNFALTNNGDSISANINKDLSLDLNFAADKSMTARKGPTPTFTRGSSGTFVNANGLIVGKTTAATLILTPSIQAIGSQVSVIVPSGSVVGWVIGQPISLIVDTDGQDDPDATELWLLGNIISIGADILTFTVTSRTAQAGSATSWTLGYRGPRFDHDPVTLDCKGLLIEEGRTNFVLNSDLYSSATATNITATTITGTSVTGSNQIRELSLTSSGASTGVQFNATGTGTGSKTLSVFIKKPASNAAPYFTIGFASSAFIYAGIQLTMSGSIPVVSVTSTTAGGFSVVSSAIEAFPNNWYRVSVVVSGTPASCFPTMYPSNAVWNGTSDIRQTLTASGTNLIHIFGAQLEAGSFPTSYIPTTTTTASRSADLCSITSSAFTSFYNQAEWSVVTKVVSAAGIMDTTQYPLAFSDATTSNQLFMLRFGSIGGTPRQCRFSSTVVGSDGLSDSPMVGTLSDNTTAIFGFAIKLNNFAGSLNGNLITDSTVSLPTVDRMFIGSRVDSTRYWGGHIAYIRYYQKRLPDAKLQALTV